MTRLERSPWLTTFGLAAAAFLIMMLPAYQPLVDLPAHIAHFYYSLGGGRPPALASFVRYEWDLLPTLGSEILVYALNPLFGLEWSTKIVVAATPALTVSGIVALALAIHGRISPFTILAVSLAFNFPFTFGFLNFCMSAGMAFWAAAVWIRLSRSNRSTARLVFGLVASPIIMITHLGGWTLLGAIVGGATLWERRELGWFKAATSTILDCLPLAWPVLILLLKRKEAGAEISGWLSIPDIVEWSASVLREKWLVVDVASACLVYGACLTPLFARRDLRFEPALLIPAALVWLAVVFVPLAVFASLYANVRLAPYALILTLLAIQPKRDLPPWTWGVALAFVVFRFAVVLAVMLQGSAKIERQLGALDHIRPASRVLSFALEQCGRTWNVLRSRNIHLYATVRRDALINGHFMVPGQHLLTINYPPAGDLMKSGGNLVTNFACSVRQSYAQALTSAPVSAFDYVWLLEVPEDQLPVRPDLRRVWSAEDSALFEVIRPLPVPQR
jgi:hypothetical protein